MTPRINYVEASPGAFRALIALQTHVRRSGLDPMLEHLVYLRVSQINGCAYCVDMHDKDLRAGGETSERLALVAVWHDAHNFTPRERAALAWAEAVTRLGADAAPEALYEATRAEFGDAGLVELTLAIATINAWNRMNIAFRTPSGVYQPPTK
jgi:AhpD family alkylhydroperoxidase